MTVRVTRRSNLTGVESSMELPIEPREYLAASRRWRSGMLVQDAFPALTAEQRESLMTGATPDEWGKMFTDEEDDR